MSRARGNLTFEDLALISLSAVPVRMLVSEGATDEQVIAEIVDIVSDRPKRTKHQIRRYGPGRPTIRIDLLALGLGDNLRWQDRCDDFNRRHHLADKQRVADLIRRAAEPYGGLDQTLVEQARQWDGHRRVTTLLSGLTRES